MGKIILTILKSIALGVFAFVWYVFWLQLFISNIGLPTQRAEPSLLIVYIIARGFIVFPGDAARALLASSNWVIDDYIIDNSVGLIILLSIFSWGFLALKITRGVVHLLPRTSKKTVEILKAMLSAIIGACLAGLASVSFAIMLPSMSGNLVEKCLVNFGDMQLNPAGKWMVKEGLLSATGAKAPGTR